MIVGSWVLKAVPWAGGNEGSSRRVLKGMLAEATTEASKGRTENTNIFQKREEFGSCQAAGKENDGGEERIVSGLFWI